MKRSDVGYKMVIVSMGLAYVIVAIMAYWAFYPYKVVEYNVYPIPVLQDVVKVGDKLDTNREIAKYHVGDSIILYHDMCKFMDVPAKVMVQIENSITVGVTMEPIVRPEGCQKYVSQAIKVPSFIKSGERARVIFNVYYQVNPIKEIHKTFVSEYFLVE